MLMQEFESQLSESSRKTFEYCQHHINKVMNLQRELFHLSTVLGFGMKQHELCWERLRRLFVNHMYIRDVHSVSFQSLCNYKSFWDKKPNTITNENGAVLFCRRTTKLIDVVDNKQVLERLGASNKLLVKSTGKFSFIYIEFEPDQTLFDFADISASFEFLQPLFDIFQDDNKDQIHSLLFDIGIWLAENSLNIISSILNKKCQSRIDGNTVIVPGDAPLTILLSQIYSETAQNIQFYKSVIFRSRISKKQGQRCVYKDGKILYTCNLFGLSNLSLQNLENLPFKDMLSYLNMSSKIISNILQKAEKQGNNLSNCKNWNLLVNQKINAIEIVINNKRVTRKVDISECHVMKELLSQGLKNLQETIGNQFIPEIADQSQSFIRKASKRVYTYVLKPGSGKSLKIEFKESSEIRQLKDMEFNILNYDLNNVCNFVKNMFIDRFPGNAFFEEKLHNFISKVAYSYEKTNNPFHNMYHGFTVLHGAYILSLNKSFQSIFNTNAILAFLVSALCHDLAHTGFTNSYEQKVESKLANRYGDRSILENNSIAKALKLFAREQTNFLVDMQHTEWKTFRRILVSSILATDNKNHTIVLAEFDAIVTEEKNGEFCQDSIEKLLGALLHCCDFWGNVKPYPISKQWSERVNKEFSHQYEKELEAGVEPTPYFRDLNNIRVVAKNQNVFISAIVYPLYKKIDEWMDGYLQPCLTAIDENLILWKRIEEGTHLEAAEKPIT